MIYLEFPSSNPYFNLAFEQYVFDCLDKAESYFALWQNDNSIIVGKNQNTVEEINAGFVKERDVKVARRLSGGGAVYHDLGNLNFTFIADAKNADKLDLKFFCLPIQKALASIGIKAEIGGRNDITIEGKKFSGNAQYVKDGRIMHHGTIMFSSDLNVLSQALSVDNEKIFSKGIKSTRARVANISEFLDKPISLAEFKEILIENVFENNPRRNFEISDKDMSAVEKLSEKYASWEWNYGRSPQYTVKKERRVENCGKIEIVMNVDKGIVEDMCFYGDFFGLKDCADLAVFFVGRAAREDIYQEVLKGINVGDYFNNLTNEQFLEILK